jgi:glycosyltransferase involved in cell wall biosynthesis
VVKDGETGFLVEPPYDVNGVYEPMLKLGKDKELRERLGKSAREFMIANFSHESVAQKFWQFFHSLKK